VNKKQLRNDLAVKVVRDIEPKMREYQERHYKEMAGFNKAEKKLCIKLYQADNASKEEGVSAVVNEKKCYDPCKARHVYHVLNDLAIHPRYCGFSKEVIVKEDGESETIFKYHIVIEDKEFEGQGHTKLLAKALAAAEGLSKILGIDFDKSEGLYLLLLFAIEG